MNILVKKSYIFSVSRRHVHGSLRQSAHAALVRGQADLAARTEDSSLEGVTACARAMKKKQLKNVPKKKVLRARGAASFPSVTRL